MKVKYSKRGGGGIARRRGALGEWRLNHVRAQGYTNTKIVATAAGVVEMPLAEEIERCLESAGWIVTVFDNDYNTYEQVMAILMVATECGGEEAFMEAWEVDHLGKSVVHYADEKECRRAADVISKIGIKVTVSEE